VNFDAMAKLIVAEEFTRNLGGKVSNLSNAEKRRNSSSIL
jgi:hypothetical protein